jgi:competence protein ComEC
MDGGMMMGARFFLHIILICICFDSTIAYAEMIDLNLKDDEMAITFLSLNNGEIALIHLPDHQYILLTNGQSTNVKQLKEQLSYFKVNHIQRMLLTSHDAIDVELLTELIHKYHVQEVISGKKILFQKGSVFNTVWQEGKTYSLSEQLHAKILWKEMNPLLLNFQFSFYEHQLVWFSSCSKDGERHILQLPLKNVNIIKVANYAEEQSITEQIVHHMDPQVAIIFYSKNQRPHEDIMKLLNESWIDVYYTKNHGLVTIKFSPTNYEVITLPPELK